MPRRVRSRCVPTGRSSAPASGSTLRASASTSATAASSRSCCGGWSPSPSACRPARAREIMIVRSGVGLVHAEIVEREPRVRKMTDSDMPSLVVVTGPPAAGKTTIADALAARLGWPLIAKDPLKEVLADALGVRGRDASQELGVATFDVLFHVLAQLLGSGVSVIAEGNFGRAEPFAALPPARLLQ